MTNPRIFERQVSLSSGDTYFYVVGKGTPMLVIHGGPAMEHTYMLEGVQQLAATGRKLYFYDQLGAGRSPMQTREVDTSRLSAQLKDVLEWIGERETTPIEVLAHSWGTLLLMKTFPSGRELLSKKIILVSPMPLTWERNKTAVDRFVAKVPQHVVSNVERLEASSNRSDGVKVMKLLEPYYLSPDAQCKDLMFGDYGVELNAKIMSENADYDIRSTAESYNKAAVIIGDADFIQFDGVAEILSEDRTYRVKGAGHFPFVEQKQLFFDAVNSYLAE